MSNWKSLFSQKRVQLVLAVLLFIILLVGLWSVHERVVQRLGEFIPALRPTPVLTQPAASSGSRFFLPYITSNPSPLVSAPSSANPTPSSETTFSTTDIGELLNIPTTPLALALIALAGIVLVWFVPLAAVPLLIVATVLDRYRFDVSSLGVRIEHLALAAVAIVWTINFLRRRERFHFEWDDALLALYWFIGLVASFLNAPSFKESLKFLGLMGLGFLSYWLVKRLVTDETKFRRAFVAWLTVGVGEALFGLIAWVAMPFGLNLGVQFYPFGPNPGFDISCRNFTYSPYGTLFESNIFGSYTMGVSLVLLTLWLSSAFRPARKFLVAGLLLGVIAVALSLTRGALAGFAVGVVAILFVAENKWRERVKITAFAIVILAVAVFGATELAERLVTSPQSPVSFALANECAQIVRAQPILRGTTPSGPGSLPAGEAPRVTPVASATPTPRPNSSSATTTGSSLTLERLLASESVGYRLDSYRRAVNDWLAHPWIGNGANVFAQRYITTSRTRDWIDNVELMALHDTGVIGFVVLFGWLFGIGRDLVRATRSAAPGFTRTALLALAISFVGLFVAYQVTTAFWLGFTWVQLGLLRAGTQLLQTPRAGE